MNYYKRNLPHYHPEGYAYFVTTRLAGTIPKDIFNNIKNEYDLSIKKISGLKNLKRKNELCREIQNDEFLNNEKILHSLKFGRDWLKDESIANVIKESLHYQDGKQFDLIAYTIMPNHIHVVFIPIVERDSSRSSQTKNKELSDINVALQEPVVTRIMRLLKGSTARKANEILNRKGQFWQHESYDHVIRNRNELHRIVKYILNNPVNAGLCVNSDEWEWNYYNSKFLI